MHHTGGFVADVKTKGISCRESSLVRKRRSRLSKKGDWNKGKALKKATDVFRANAKYARAIWGELPETTIRSLKELADRHVLSVSAGDLQLLEGRWYVTHAGLLRIAQRRRCAGIKTSVQRDLSVPSSSRWVFKATIYKMPGSKRFVGYGDADPSNVSPLVRGAEMRVAETRAVNRALRKAYGIGLCSVEELGSFFGPAAPAQSNGSRGANYANNGQPRLRDQLCLLIRQYNLDPALVKAYAAAFCGTQTLKEASRDLVESFVSHLATSAKEDLDGLVCKLHSFAQPPEAKP